MGTGAGFPGMPLAITNPELKNNMDNFTIDNSHTLIGSNIHSNNDYAKVFYALIKSIPLLCTIVIACNWNISTSNTINRNGRNLS